MVWLTAVSVWTPPSSFHEPAGLPVDGAAAVRQRTMQAVITAPTPPVFWGSVQVTLNCPLPLPAFTFPGLSGVVQVVVCSGAVDSPTFKSPS